MIAQRIDLDNNAGMTKAHRKFLTQALSLVLITTACGGVHAVAAEDALDASACVASLAKAPFSDDICQAALATIDGQLEPQQYYAVTAALAAGYARMGDPRATDYLGLSEARTETSWQTENNLGVAQLYLKRFTDARLAFSRALNDPDAPTYIYLNRALALRGSGDFAGAANDVAQYEALNQQAERLDFE